MVKKIIWSGKAKSHLRGIFEHYTHEASREVAEKIIEGLLKTAEQLIKQPNSGQRETLFKESHLEFRYLVKVNYKIIYWKDADKIHIASVFDCRQNPEKMADI